MVRWAYFLSRPCSPSLWDLSPSRLRHPLRMSVFQALADCPPGMFVFRLPCLVCILRRVQLFATPWAAARQAPPSMGFSGRESWSGCQGLLRPFPRVHFCPETPTLQGVLGPVGSLGLSLLRRCAPVGSWLSCCSRSSRPFCRAWRGWVPGAATWRDGQGLRGSCRPSLWAQVSPLFLVDRSKRWEERGLVSSH